MAQRRRRQPGGPLCVMLVVLVAMMAPRLLWSEEVEEYAAKAALALNFARFTDWPASSVAASPAALRVCVFADEWVIAAFQGIEGKPVGERQVRLISLRGRDDPSGCDLLFIDSQDRRKISLLVSGVRDRPVLTMGEIPGFADYGGIINLYWSEGKIRFEISPKAAKRANLFISSRVLRLARIVD